MLKISKNIYAAALGLGVLVSAFSGTTFASADAPLVTMLYSDDFEDTSKWPAECDKATLTANGWTVPDGAAAITDTSNTTVFKLGKNNYFASYVFDDAGYFGGNKLVAECRIQMPWSNANYDMSGYIYLTDNAGNNLTEIKATTATTGECTLSYINGSGVYTVDKNFTAGKFYWIRQVVDIDAGKVTMYYLESKMGDDAFRPGKMNTWGKDALSSTYNFVNEADNVSSIKIKGSSRFDDFNIYIGEASILGMMTTAEACYFMNETLNNAPRTIEATVFFPKNLEKEGGAVVSNYDGEKDSIGLYIDNNGAPELSIKSGDELNIKFDEVNLYNGKPTHIAIVNDTDSLTAHCYIDGELKQSITYNSELYPSMSSSLVIGGDRTDVNSAYFKGTLIDLALFDGIRASEEIEKDFNTKLSGKSDMVLCYDMSEISNKNIPYELKDLSGNGNDSTLNFEFTANVDKPEDFAYSFAVVGDTQKLTYSYPQYLTNVYDWIIDNMDEDNIEFVFGLGDITDGNQHSEWTLAKAVIQKLDGVLPYSIVKGNHDKDPEYTAYFPYSEYSERLSGSFDGTMLNTYQFITVNGLKYLIFAFDYGATDEVLNWAGNIIEDNPDCNVIITTHAYLYRDGTTLDSGDGTPPSSRGDKYNDGDEMWDKLIRKYENIVLVLSGHDITDYIVLAQDEGNNGNTVSQLLINPQGVDQEQRGVGLVAMLYFSEDGSKVTVRYYSTVKDKFYKSENQFSFDINVIRPELGETKKPSMEINDVSLNVKLTQDEYSGKVVAVAYDEFDNITATRMYDAKETVKVSFPKSAKASTVKVFWWDGLGKLTPVLTTP